jgi:hypothetical protein
MPLAQGLSELPSGLADWLRARDASPVAGPEFIVVRVVGVDGSVINLVNRSYEEHIEAV